jgi:hypothetical protein
MGGSAVAMAAQVAEGYALISAVQLKRVTDPELDQLQQELEKTMRDLRVQIIPQDDIAAIQGKNRKMTRITGAMQQIQMTRAKRRRGM